MILPVPAELISQMAVDLQAHLARRGITEPRFIGIRSGGIWVGYWILSKSCYRLSLEYSFS